jgi:hypothetical protein
MFLELETTDSTSHTLTAEEDSASQASGQPSILKIEHPTTEEEQRRQHDDDLFDSVANMTQEEIDEILAELGSTPAAKEPKIGSA